MIQAAQVKFILLYKINQKQQLTNLKVLNLALNTKLQRMQLPMNSRDATIERWNFIVRELVEERKKSLKNTKKLKQTKEFYRKEFFLSDLDSSPVLIVFSFGTQAAKT